MKDLKEKTDWISGLFSSADQIYAWCYDENGALLYTTCPNAGLIDLAFDMCESKDRVVNYFKRETSPYMAGLPFGLVWVAVLDKKAQPQKHIYLLGPVMSGNVSLRQIQLGLDHCERKYPGKYPIMEIARCIKEIQVVSGNLLQRYALMLHYILNGEKLSVTDISTRADSSNPTRAGWMKMRDRHQNWMAEQALMHMVREGDLNYEGILRKAQSVGAGVHMEPSGSLRALKNTIIVFTTCCTRAAIEGGLSPDEAYSLGDLYIQQAEESNNISELTMCSHTMYEDFITRVHKKRSNPKLSSIVQSCCDYVEMRVEEKVRIRDLAQKMGYTEYYISKRFKQEVGVTINTYIKMAKIKRAKLYLLCTDADIGEISDSLCFSSPSYFGEVFTELEGVTPSKYRAVNKK